jgi:hypothetical protein
VNLERYRELSGAGCVVRVWRGDRFPAELRDAMHAQEAGELLLAIAYDDKLGYSTAKAIAAEVLAGYAIYTGIPALESHHEEDTGEGPCACPGSFVLVYARESVR